MFSLTLQTILHKKNLVNVALILLVQCCTGKSLYNVVQLAPENIAQGKNPVQCYLKTFGTILQKPCIMLCKWRATDNIAQEKSCSMLSQYFWDNIAKVKTLCNVVQLASDNIAPEKIQFKVVLILLGQHFTKKALCNVAQEASDNISQKKSCSLCWSMLFKYSWSTTARQKSYDMFSLRLQTTLRKKKSCSMLSQYSWDIFAQVKTLWCSVVQEAPHKTAKEKILFNVV